MNYTIKEYYKLYINNIIKQSNDTILKINELRIDIYNINKYLYEHKIILLDNNINIIIEKFINSINLNRDTSKDIIYINDILDKSNNVKLRQYIIQMIKYKSLNINIKDLLKTLDILKIKSKIKYREFENYIRLYYNTIHKNLIKGYQYKFINGFGYLSFNRYKFDHNNENKKPILDYAATNKRKQDIIKEGKIPYNKKDAELYKIKGLKYNGIKYYVYKEDNVYIDLEVLDSTIKTKVDLIFEKINYIGLKLRNNSFDDLAKHNNTLDKINNLQLSLYHKMTIYNKVNELNYLNYIRDESEHKYNYRKYYSKNRQRFQS